MPKIGQLDRDTRPLLGERTPAVTQIRAEERSWSLSQGRSNLARWSRAPRGGAEKPGGTSALRAHVWMGHDVPVGTDITGNSQLA